MRKFILRGAIEMGFILFLFYANLLMGDFKRGGMGRKNGILWAFGDIFTAENFAIGVASALIAYVLFECLREKT